MKQNKKEQYLDRSQSVLDEQDPKKRWRMIHDLLREVNPRARREQDKQSKAMSRVRKAQLYNNNRAPGAAGLRFSVSIPNITWQALIAVDSRLSNPSKGTQYTKNATNILARDLEEVFPEYRAS